MCSWDPGSGTAPPGGSIPAGGWKHSFPHYVGIMGAESDLVNNPPQFVENRRRPCCDCCDTNCYNGIVAAGGMLLQNDPVGMQRCSDGTSNVMILGETSTFAFQDAVLKTGRQRIDQGYPHGWMMGTASGEVIRDALDHEFQRTHLQPDHDPLPAGNPGLQSAGGL